MPTPFLRAAFAAASLSFASAGAPSWAQTPAQVPVETFFQNRALNDAILSPTARYVALALTPQNGRTRLAVLDTDKLAATVVAAFDNADVTTFWWVNDERLAFRIDDREAAGSDRRFPTGLYAVNRDGGEMRKLTPTSTLHLRLDSRTRVLATTRKQDSDDIFVTVPRYDALGDQVAVNLARLNTRTGRATEYNRPGNTVAWLLDGADVPRVTVTREAGKAAVHYLDPDNEKWRVLGEFDWHDSRRFVPWQITQDGTLYVTARNARDKSALHRFDLAKGAIDPEPLVALTDFDFQGGLIYRGSAVVGVRHLTDSWGTAWLDPALKQAQAKVDALLPNATNLLDVATRAEAPYVLVRTYSDTDPGALALYNLDSGKLVALGTTLRDVDPRQMTQRDLVRYKARDGLEIPAWLTLPKGGKGKKLPMVVLVHDGPWVRGGAWRWDAASQFLASRGFAVLEPEFRGSRGYGDRHFRAGFKQLGLAMQNDVADGAQWAVGQGIAQAGHICIAGGGYGGYSALMGLANDPELYKCGVGWQVLTDIELMFEPGYRSATLDYLEYDMPVLIGDRKTDAAQLKAISPIHQAARIKQPILLSYGGRDRRIPLVHGTRFRDEVKKHNPDVEWVEYPEEAQGWHLVKNRVDFWTRAEKFLQRQIGVQ